MRTAEEMRDNGYGVNRDAGGEVQAYWAGKCRGCPTRRNGNCVYNDSVSVSCKGVSDKEVARPAYVKQNYSSGDGF